MEFKVGDRVRYSPTGIQGVVTRPSASLTRPSDIGVVWDGEDVEGVYFSENIELVEEQPNRTYYDPPVTQEDILKVRTLGEQLGVQTFEQNVHRILNGVAETVVQKNVSYGDSALNPIRVFSKADRMEQLFVRLDDKLSRVQRGSEYPGDDTLRDIIGYATLILIARESE